MSTRIVSAEILDGLPNHNPAAIRSRRDLHRVHRAMRTRSIVLRALRSSQLNQRKPAKVRILEIGAGDGHFMLGVARSLHSGWRSVEMTLIDRVDLVDPSTISQYSALGWQVNSVVADVFEWVDRPFSLLGGENHWDLIIANLFLHHFEGEQLLALMTAIESRSDCFFACEPRRSWISNAGSHLIGAIGVNAVTRADAVTSVQAGFCDAEISDVWPGTRRPWTIKEYPAPPFSHCFYAERSTVQLDSTHATHI